MAKSRRRTNKHHLYFPRREYATPIERKFRNLPCNIVEMDITVHNNFHANSLPPRKPPRSQMVSAIDRHDMNLCGCFCPERRAR